MHVPARAYLAFDNAPVAEAIGRKLREFNAVLQGQGLGLAAGEEAGTAGLGGGGGGGCGATGSGHRGRQVQCYRGEGAAGRGASTICNSAPLRPSHTPHRAGPSQTSISRQARSRPITVPFLLSSSAGPLDALLGKLPAAAASSGCSGTAAFTPGDITLLHALLAWPAAQLFPALDVARTLALDPGGAAALAAGECRSLMLQHVVPPLL